MSYFIKVCRQLINYIQRILKKNFVISEYRINKIVFSKAKVKGTGKNIHKSLCNQNEVSVIETKNLPRSNQSASSCETFLLQDKLKNSLHEWGKDYSNVSFNQQYQQMYQQIYDVLGNDTLKAETVSELIYELTNDNKLLSIKLFEGLEYFYQRWCRGEFIDAPPEGNLPQQKMLQLKQSSNTSIGLRQIDVNTGLNVMILLLELHRMAQKHYDLKDKIKFASSGQSYPDKDNFFTSQLLRVINYSDAIAIGHFSNLVGEFLHENDFSRAYLGDANLVNVNFEAANLSHSYLENANLTGANFSNADLSFANLADANLSGANLIGANLDNIDLSGADLSGADLSGVNLSNADLSTADLNSAKLDGANLNHTNFTSAMLRDAQLNNTNLSHAILFGANLSDTLLEQANLQYADLCRTDLSGANLNYANIKGANISDSILFCTSLRNAILLSTDLSYAKLNGAQLIGSNLQNAILIGADLSHANLKKIVWNEQQEWQEVKGLEKAINVPVALQNQLKID